MTSSRASLFIGLERKSLNPAANTFSLSSIDEKAVCATIGSFGRIYFINFTASNPSITGIFKSINTKLMSSFFLQISTASAPFFA
jgi:hypothetical protein